MSNLLDDLFFKYHADKTPRIKHHYSDVYYELFKYKRETVKKVLEIGTAEGASLFAWRDFFPNAQIYGAEIEQKRVDLFKGQERIEVFKCDQSKGDDLINLLKKTGYDLDLVVDDGSHNPLHQVFTAKVLQPRLKDAYYIIEDVDDASADMIYDLLKRHNSWMYKVGSRHDDRLIKV